MGGMKEIRLTQDRVAIVDDDLHDWLNQWKWYYKQGYACRNEYVPIHRTIRMHVVINQTPDGYSTDHMNGNKLDNRRNNLRTVNHHQNGLNRGLQINNTSGFKGVYWHKRDRKWRAQVRINGKKTYIGAYADKQDAALAIEAAIKKHHGEYGRIQ